MVYTKEPFRKDQLETYMRVELGKGKIYILMEDRDGEKFLFNPKAKKFIYLNHYDENLRYIRDDPDYEIECIYDAPNLFEDILDVTEVGEVIACS